MNKKSQDQTAFPIGAFTLGANLIDDDEHSTPTCDQDFWGSSMSLAAVEEGRIFGVFGVARQSTSGRELFGGNGS